MSNSKSTAILRAMRPHQWTKNLLLAMPLLLAHQTRNSTKDFSVVLAIVCFCLCASAGYFINDAMDAKEDRGHPTKRNRPFASGALPMSIAPIFAGVFYLVAFASAYIYLPRVFVGWLALYVAVSLAYSFYFKRKLLVDVILLAGLYTLRILAGGAAVNVEVSPWMLAFSIFLFLSLAFAKRYVELTGMRERAIAHSKGRGYFVEDLDIIQTVGPCAGYLSVLVFAMYIYSSELVKSLYPRPLLLWLICPLLLYWITRVWFLARRKTLHEDPVLFALRDRVSWGCAAIAMVLVFLASSKII